MQTSYLQTTLITLTACLPMIITSLTNAEERVIYGEDNRKEFHDSTVSEVAKKAARSVGMILNSQSLRQKQDQTTSLPTITYGESHGLCKDEPFWGQPAPGDCSGFLVGEDIFVTAGHCISSQFECQVSAIVFDFVDQGSAAESANIDSKNVYQCQEIIARSYNKVTKEDYAVIKLNKKVTDRKPLKLQTDKVRNSAEITAIGHPRGLPLKITDGGTIRNNTSQIFFRTSLDTYQGNSGSPVINKDGEVEGILVRGERDFDLRGDCYVSKVCETGECRGEDVTRSSVFANWIPDPNEQSLPRINLAPITQKVEEDIPDGEPDGGTEVVFQVTDSGELAELNVSMDIQHSYPSDLIIELENPNGKTVVLANRIYQESTATTWNFGYDGIIVPELRKLRRQEVKGTWKLRVIDTAKDDTGYIERVTLKLRVYRNVADS